MKDRIVKFPSDLENLMLAIDDVVVWLGVEEGVILQWVADGWFPPPVLMERPGAPPATRRNYRRWYRYEIEDWLGNLKRDPDTGYGYLGPLPKRVRLTLEETTDGYCRVASVAAWLGIDMATVYRWVREGRPDFPSCVQIPANKDGFPQRLFKVSEIRAWLAGLPRGRSGDEVVTRRGVRSKSSSRSTRVRKDSHADPSRAGKD